MSTNNGNGQSGGNGHHGKFQSCNNDFCLRNGGVIAPGESCQRVGSELFHAGCYQLWQQHVAERQRRFGGDASIRHRTRAAVNTLVP